MIFFK